MPDEEKSKKKMKDALWQAAALAKSSERYDLAEECLKAALEVDDDEDECECGSGRMDSEVHGGPRRCKKCGKPVKYRGI